MPDMADGLTNFDSSVPEQGWAKPAHAGFPAYAGGVAALLFMIDDDCWSMLMIDNDWWFTWLTNFGVFEFSGFKFKFWVFEFLSFEFLS